MISTDQKGSDAVVPHNAEAPELNLRFMSELGRSLLFAVHPKKIAAKAAKALYSEFGLSICAVAVELEHFGFVSATFNSDGKNTDSGISRKRFREWVSFLPYQVSYLSENREEFFLNHKKHGSEYIVPLQINGEAKGAVILGLSKGDSLDENSRKLIESATQMTTLRINLTTHYEAALYSSILKATEEPR